MNTKYITLGTFVLVTLGAFGWLASQLGLGDRGGTHYTVRTADAAGLVEGNSVRIAGVEVGKVEQIHVDGNMAVIDLRIRPGTSVWADACAAVHIKGMLGEKFLGISQGMTGTAMAPDSEFQCVTPTVDFDNALNATKDMVYGEDSLLPHISRIAKRVDTFTAALDEGPGLPRERLEKALTDLEHILSETRGLLEDNRADVRVIAQSARRLLEDPRLPRMLANGDKLLAVLERETPPLLDKGDRLLTRANVLVDDAHLAKFDTILDDGAAAVGDLKKISHDFRNVGVDLKPAIKALAPMITDLATLAKRATHITEAKIRQMFQIEGFRVRIAKNRKIERLFGDGDEDEKEGFQGP